MNIGNPLLTKERLGAAHGTDVLTINGVINKTGFMFLALLMTFGYTWKMAMSGVDIMPYAMGGAIGGFVLAMIIIFGQMMTPFLILPYAACQGLFLGGLSAIFEKTYPGIVMQAALLTITCFSAILLAYYTKVIRYSAGFAKFITISLVGIMLAYLASFIGSFFGMPMSFMHDSSPLSIGISIFIVGIATLSFILDFEAIKWAAQNRVDRKQEWYCAFSLVVSLVWLYLEILRLLSKLRGRD